MTFNQLVGIIPAIVFPTATLVQLGRILQKRSAAGVSVSAWALFGVANIAIYFYAERYTEWQAIVGMLVTAVLDFAIVGICLFGFRDTHRHTRAPEPPETLVRTPAFRRKVCS